MQAPLCASVGEANVVCHCGDRMDNHLLQRSGEKRECETEERNSVKDYTSCKNSFLRYMVSGNWTIHCPPDTWRQHCIQILDQTVYLCWKPHPPHLFRLWVLIQRELFLKKILLFHISILVLGMQRGPVFNLLKTCLWTDNSFLLSLNPTVTWHWKLPETNIDHQDFLKWTQAWIQVFFQTPRTLCLNKAKRQRYWEMREVWSKEHWRLITLMQIKHFFNTLYLGQDETNIWTYLFSQKRCSWDFDEKSLYLFSFWGRKRKTENFIIMCGFARNKQLILRLLFWGQRKWCWECFSRSSRVGAKKIFPIILTTFTVVRAQLPRGVPILLKDKHTTKSFSSARRIEPVVRL